MQRIILIDNNTLRQKNEYLGKNLEEFTDVLYNAIDEKYTEIYEQLKQGNVSILDFEVIIVHSGAFDDNEEIFDLLQDYCKETNKKLIYFSGGQQTVGYGSTTNVMYIHSKTLYKNLSTFLEDENLNIKILVYGKNWKINALNSVFKKIKKSSKDMESSGKIRTKVFRKEVGFDLIENLIPSIESLNKTFLVVADFENIMEIIKAEIKDQI